MLLRSFVVASVCRGTCPHVRVEPPLGRAAAAKPAAVPWASRRQSLQSRRTVRHHLPSCSNSASLMDHRWFGPRRPYTGIRHTDLALSFPGSTPFPGSLAAATNPASSGSCNISIRPSRNICCAAARQDLVCIPVVEGRLLVAARLASAPRATLPTTALGPQHVACGGPRPPIADLLLPPRRLRRPASFSCSGPPAAAAKVLRGGGFPSTLAAAPRGFVSLMDLSLLSPPTPISLQRICVCGTH